MDSSPLVGHSWWFSSGGHPAVLRQDTLLSHRNNNSHRATSLTANSTYMGSVKSYWIIWDRGSASIVMGNSEQYYRLWARNISDSVILNVFIVDFHNSVWCARSRCKSNRINTETCCKCASSVNKPPCGCTLWQCKCCRGKYFFCNTLNHD